MRIPEMVIWAADGASETFNHVCVVCPPEKRKLFKKLFKQEYTAHRIKEMTDLLEELTEKSVELSKDSDRQVYIGEYDEEEYDDEEYDDENYEDDDEYDVVEKVNGYSWTFDQNDIKEYGVNIESTDEGFLITNDDIPIYTQFEGDFMVGDSNAIPVVLQNIKQSIQEIEYYGCVGFGWSDSHCGETVYSEFNSNEENGNDTSVVYDYVGKKLNKLLKDEGGFQESFEDQIDEYDDEYDEYDANDLSGFFDLYKSYIDDEGMNYLAKTLIPLYIKKNDYKSIKTISEWKNAITEENILKFIELASENVDDGGDVQITAFLLNYKNKHFPNVECSFDDFSIDDENDEDDE